MWLFYILLLYILVMALILYGKGQSRGKDKLFLMLTFGVFLFLSAFRASFVGNDTDSYLNLFYLISGSDNSEVFTSRYEVGYVYLNKLISYFSANPQAILIVTSCIILLGFSRFIYKNSNYIWLSVFLFFILRYFDATMNTLRFNIALVIILYSYYFIKRKKMLVFILFTLIASLFHITAIIFLLAYPISRLKFNIKTIVVLTVTGFILFSGFSVILQKVIEIFPRYQYYIGSHYLDGNIRLASIMNILVSLFMLTIGIITKYHKPNYNKDSKMYADNSKYNDGEIMLLLVVMGSFIDILSLKFNLLDRVGTYFQVFVLVYLPNAIKQMKDSKKALLMVIIIIFILVTYAITIQIVRPEWNRIYPFGFFWNER
jgi:hypothetical protein